MRVTPRCRNVGMHAALMNLRQGATCGLILGVLASIFVPNGVALHEREVSVEIRFVTRRCSHYSRASFQLRGGAGDDAGWSPWKALATPKLRTPRPPSAEETPIHPNGLRHPQPLSPTRSFRPKDLASAAATWAAAQSRNDFSLEVEDGDLVVPGDCKTVRQAMQRVGPGRRVLIRDGECTLATRLAVRRRKGLETKHRSVHLRGGWRAGDGGSDEEEISVKDRATIVWGAWEFGRGVGGTMLALTLALRSDIVKPQVENDILLDVRGGTWSMKDVQLRPLHALGMRVATDGNVSLFRCDVMGAPPDLPAADGIVCMESATLAAERCRFRWVGIFVLDEKDQSSVFGGNLTEMGRNFVREIRAKTGRDPDMDNDEFQRAEEEVRKRNSRYGMQDPGVVPWSTSGCAVNLYQRSKATVLDCRFQKCGIGVNICDDSVATIVHTRFHDTEVAFHVDPEAQQNTTLLSSGNKISGEGRVWVDKHRPRRLRELNVECEQEEGDAKEHERAEKELREMRELHAPAEFKEPYLARFGDRAKEAVDAVHWDMTTEEAERELSPELKGELAAIDASVDAEVEAQLPPFKEFGIYMPTFGDPIPGDLGHLEVDPEEEIAKAQALSEDSSSDGVGPMPEI